jgi:ClpX C4-type zinc finger
MSGSIVKHLPPAVIAYARLVAYACNDDEVVFTDRIELYVGDGTAGMTRLGEVPNLAICSNYCIQEDILLFFCDERWDPQGVIACSSIDGAKIKAERGYSGLATKWIDSPYADADVDHFLREVYAVDPRTEWWRSVCAFCGRDDTETDAIIAGPRASICRACAVELYDAFEARSHER